ncbi:hypothetical protein BDY24DRAFT_438040, partial [Mrakia frigida]|uniref:uncharacterized protein n=1 Tax=Mrakia frigida TaxID=29902 RepID=UPI003FCC1438
FSPPSFLPFLRPACLSQLLPLWPSSSDYHLKTASAEKLQERTSRRRTRSPTLTLLSSLLSYQPFSRVPSTSRENCSPEHQKLDWKRHDTSLSASNRAGEGRESDEGGGESTRRGSNFRLEFDRA